MNLNPFRRGILFGTVVSVLGMALLVGAVFIFIISLLTAKQVRENADAHLSELVATVENSAAVACFVGDEQLAKELANGLLKNQEVARVIIHAGSRELARAERNQDSATTTPLLRSIASPFNAAEIIGEIRVEADQRVLEQQVRHEVSLTASLLSLQLLVVMAAVMAIVLRVIVRPIRALSQGLHHLDAKVGEQLTPPPGHEQNEIAALTQDINNLTANLVGAIQQEHQLSLLREQDAQRYRKVFDNAGSGIFTADDNGLLLSFNPAFNRITQSTGNAEIPLSKLSQIAWRNPVRLFELLERCARTRLDQAEDFEIALTPPRWVHVILTALDDRQIQGIVTDITQSKRAEEQALLMVLTDQLTGLPNRLGLEQHFTETLREKPGEFMTLILVNIKGFRRINESLGIAVGDAVLKAISERLMACIKNTDHLARLGNDEFAIVLHGVGTRSAAESVATRVIHALGKAADIREAQVAVNCNAGIAFYPADSNDLPMLQRQAGFALAQARQFNGAGYEFFTPNMVEAAERRYQLETDLRNSISAGQLRLFYQPIVDLANGRLLGAEALVRWQHPERGLVPPDAFIPLAESNGFICELGAWVLETACQQLALWQRLFGQDFYLTVNVSTRQIPDELPVSRVLETLRRFGVPPQSLALEVTEGVLLSDFDNALTWINGLREAGCHVYLDDFGTGYSSLSYLKRFPVDAVKIDKSFVRDMKEDSSDRALVQAIVVMAKALGLRVVAEGVENAEQMTLLTAMGCQRGQGYYFAKPLPSEQFEQRFKA